MCGIAGLHRRNGVEAPSLPVLAEEMLLALELRGRDATGWLTIDDRGSCRIRKDVLPAHRFVKKMKRHPRRWGIVSAKQTRTLMAHTRWATVGSRSDVRNAHPHAVGSIAAVHNGTIFNDKEVFALSGHKPKTTVDSECIPALVDSMGWENAADAFELLEGGAAVALVNQEAPRDLILARVSSFPLVYGVTDEFIVWASEPQIIDRAWYRATGEAFPGQLITMREGEMLRVHDGEITKSTFEVPNWYRPLKQTPKSSSKQTKKSNKRKGRAKLRAVPETTTTRHQKTLEEYVEDTVRSLASPYEYLDDADADLADEEREDDIFSLMSDGFSRREAEQIVDDGLTCLIDMQMDDVGPNDTPIDSPRRRVETKSPATLAEEALES